MSDLRTQAIEAMAKTYFYEVGRRSGVDMAFETAYDSEQADFKYVAGLALDALVGFLTEHADEWRTAAVPVLSASQPDIAGLLAALRPPI